MGYGTGGIAELSGGALMGLCDILEVMYMTYPADTPIEEWSDGWLKLEVASILKDATYLIMYDSEKRTAGYPITREEMIACINNSRWL
jgi:hypothetical protein